MSLTRRLGFVLVWPAVSALVLVGVAALLVYAWFAVPLRHDRGEA